MRFAPALLPLMIAACASRPAPPTTPPAAAAPVVTPAPDPDAFGIAQLEIYFNDVMVMHMRRDGLVTVRRFVDDKPGPMIPVFTLAEDGTIASVDGTRGELTADGRVRNPKGDLSRFRLEGDTLALGGRSLHLDANGIVQIDGPAIGGTPPRVVGAVDRGSRRTAMLLVGMILDAGL